MSLKKNQIWFMSRTVKGLTKIEGNRQNNYLFKGKTFKQIMTVIKSAILQFKQNLE